MGLQDANQNLVYRAFMLRMWREARDDCHIWRFSLEDSATGERSGFGNLGDLMSFLIKEFGEERSVAQFIEDGSASEGED
jgi:hypothetical protein